MRATNKPTSNISRECHVTIVSKYTYFSKLYLLFMRLHFNFVLVLVSSGDGDCSDSGSSQEDSCSTSSSAQRDANVRHCDCCYCEVFGHGMVSSLFKKSQKDLFDSKKQRGLMIRYFQPSVAPVSRNYKEMRERLRQLLTKKKAKKCKTVVAGCSPQKSPSESSISNINSEAKAVTNSILRSNTPISMSTVQYNQRDQRDLEELLEFIEGNQSGKKDNKKAEKKARQKQRKVCSSISQVAIFRI